MKSPTSLLRILRTPGAPPTEPEKTYLEHIYQKLGATDRTAAVVEAMRRRLIE
jgi:hypothetical protein